MEAGFSSVPETDGMAEIEAIIAEERRAPNTNHPLG